MPLDEIVPLNSNQPLFYVLFPVSNKDKYLYFVYNITLFIICIIFLFIFYICIINIMCKHLLEFKITIQ